MKRPMVLAVLAVLTAVAVYLMVIRGDDGGGAKASDDRAEARDGARPDRQDAPRSRTPGPSRTSVGSGNTPDVVFDRPPRDPPVIYEREDGSVVRDHRKNTDASWVRPALPHRSRSPVDGNVTSAVMRQVRPVVLDCMRKVPDSAYGARPVVVTRAAISIDDQGNLTVSELGPALSDIDETAAASALACIRDAAPTLSAHVDHAAVESATLSFPIRPLDYRP